MLCERQALSATVAVAVILFAGAADGAGNLQVVSVEPARHLLTAAVGSAVTIHFDQPVLHSSVNSSSFRVFGRWSGAVAGTFSFTNGDQSVTLAPDRSFSAGETVMVVLSHDIESTTGSTLRSAGYSYQFWTRANTAPMEFVEIAEMTTRTTPQESSRAYGGIASDLDRDGWLDITLVNEDTADLRVFMNKADGTGLFEEFIEPPFPVNDRASPSEPADFDNDGFVDICVANINTNSVSILLGVGDGTFAPQQEVGVGSAPRGIAVLDVDGDGDLDIVNTNANSSNLSLLLNDGNGVFGAPTFFEGGGVGEWALAAADMNDDGILDLVVGARSSQQILVNVGNGDATFTHVSSQSSGGAVWMLVCGDVNGDGTEDVAAANSTSNNAAILLGDGTGQLGAPQATSTDPFPLATDLGDLDGDGDLDWVTSSFGGDWLLFVNNGSGNFTPADEFLSPVAASCALMLDFDNDGDLDLALIDELADVVILMQNSGATPLVPAVSEWGLMMTVLVLLVAGTVMFGRRRAAPLKQTGSEAAASAARAGGRFP
ncbi:MAG: VCBS repeat-containing protein [Phycisphaerae bacterium]